MQSLPPSSHRRRVAPPVGLGMALVLAVAIALVATAGTPLRSVAVVLLLAAPAALIWSALPGSHEPPSPAGRSQADQAGLTVERLAAAQQNQAAEIARLKERLAALEEAVPGHRRRRAG